MGTGGVLNVLALSSYLAFLAAGIVLLALGVRGRLLVDVPRCARCRQRIARGEFERSARCPECGHDLRPRGGMRFFRRRRRPGLITLGLGIGLLSMFAPMAMALLWGPSGVAAATGPNSQLAAALLSGASDDGTAALFELERRLGRGEISQAELADLAEAVVVWHERDARGFLMRGATSILLAADRTEALSDDQVRRLGDAVFAGSRGGAGVRAPSKAREGHRFNITLPTAETAGDLGREIKVISVREGETNLLEEGLAPNGAFAISLPQGTHTLSVTIETAYRFVGSAAGGYNPTAPSRVTLTRAVELAIDVVAANSPPILPIVRLDDSPKTLPQIKAVLDVHRVAIDRDAATDSCVVRGDIEFVGAVPSMTLSFDVIARIGDVDIGLGSVLITGTDGGWSRSAGAFAARCPCPADDAKVSVLFRPNLIAAEGDPNVERVWGDDVNIENVAVVRTGQSASGASR